jgi:hypothetical protein
MVGWPAGTARAEVNLRIQLTDDVTNAKLTDKESGEVTSTDNNRLDQLYNLDIARQLYPNLSLRGGVTAQLSDGRNKSEGTTTLSGSDMLHPFVDLNLATPIFTTGLGYEETELTQTGTGRATTVNSQDRMHGLFLWEPVDFPRVNLNYTSNHRYDDADTIDQRNDDLALSIRYDWQHIFTNYSYIQGKTDNLITGLQGQRDFHDGRINFNRQLTKDLNLSCGYRANYGTEVWFGSGEQFLAPLFVGGTKGFYLLDDFTIDKWDERSDGPFLVDGVKSGSSAINLGTNGDETKDVSFGLDFVFAAEISAVRVWVDRDASAVVNALQPRLYTSIDQVIWTPQPMAQYIQDIDNHYFEFTISSPSSARYIRVETTPLTTVQDQLGRFPDLYVTEVEVFSLEAGDLTRRSFDNSADMGLLWRLDPKTTMGYNVFYHAQRADTDMQMQRTTALSQTVNLNRFINRIFSGSVRGSRDERQTATQENRDYSYGAGLAAGWLDTFRQSLSYSGSTSETVRITGNNDRTQEINRSNSVLLRNVAQLYRGWSANVDLGYTLNIPWEGGKRTTKMFRVGSSIMPNPKLTVNTAYTYSVSNSDLPTTEDERGELSVAFSPSTAISMFSRFTVIDPSNTPKKVYQEYSIDWSPFPDGAVQLFLAYHENLTNEGDEIKAAQAGLDWRVNNHASLRTSLNKVKAEAATTITDSQVISMSLLVSL